MPFGSFTGFKLLAGRGPGVKIKISTIGEVETDLRSEFTSQGINQTLHRVYLQVICEVSVLTPFKDISEKITNQVLIAENVISEIVKNEPVTKIIEVGTSEFLFDRQAHIGDTLYTSDMVTMYNEASEESDILCMIYPYIDIKILSEKNGWSCITVDGIEGYIKNDYITSVALYPEVVELCRKQRILIKVNSAMDVNKPSGLTREDFVRVLSNHREDKEQMHRPKTFSPFHLPHLRYKHGKPFLSPLLS